MDNTLRQFQEADATVDQAVAAFISRIKSDFGKMGWCCASVHR